MTLNNPVICALAAARAQRLPVILPGAVDALTALIIERLDFAAVYLTGAGLANARYGVPDIGLTTLSELVDQVSAIAEATSLPVIADADTGFGNALNAQRAVRLLERAGASAIQLEDQVAPKKCGHFEGKTVVSKIEMVRVIEAAVDARRGDVAIIARTDAAAVNGLDDALDRARAYLAAGADVLFVEAPTSIVDLARIPAEVDGLHLANMVEGGKTPLLERAQLGEMGFAGVIYANAAMRAAAQGAMSVLTHLARHGTTAGVLDQMLSWSDRQELVRKPFFDELSARYASGGGR